MKKYKKLVIICLLLIICSFTIMIAVFSQLSPKISPEKQALTFYKEYLSACQKSYADAFSYVYFLNDWEKEAWMGSSQDYLVEYEILDGPHQLNESLFVIECRFQTAAGQAMGTSSTAYNFVAIIDNNYVVITHPRNIPPDLQRCFDISKYENTNEYEVDVDNIL